MAFLSYLAVKEKEFPRTVFRLSLVGDKMIIARPLTTSMHTHPTPVIYLDKIDGKWDFFQKLNKYFIPENIIGKLINAVEGCVAKQTFSEKIIELPLN